MAQLLVAPILWISPRPLLLEEMINHIYGKISLLTQQDRPHMFIKELRLNIEHYHQEVQKTSQELMDKTSKYFLSFKENLVYKHRVLSRSLLTKLSTDQKEKFLKDLRGSYSTKLRVICRKCQSALSPRTNKIGYYRFSSAIAHNQNSKFDINRSSLKIHIRRFIIFHWMRATRTFSRWLGSFMNITANSSISIWLARDV